MIISLHCYPWWTVTVPSWKFSGHYISIVLLQICIQTIFHCQSLIQTESYHQCKEWEESMDMIGKAFFVPRIFFNTWKMVTCIFYTLNRLTPCMLRPLWFKIGALCTVYLTLCYSRLKCGEFLKIQPLLPFMSALWKSFPCKGFLPNGSHYLRIAGLTFPFLTAGSIGSERPSQAVQCHGVTHSQSNI